VPGAVRRVAAGVRGAVGACPCRWACTKVSLLPGGSSLSVSRSRSLMFFSSVSQKRFLATLSTLRSELFCETLDEPEDDVPVPVALGGVTTLLCTPMVPVTSRLMLT
jgi:hypothetical protein